METIQSASLPPTQLTQPLCKQKIQPQSPLEAALFILIQPHSFHQAALNSLGKTAIAYTTNSMDWIKFGSFEKETAIPLQYNVFQLQPSNFKN